MFGRIRFDIGGIRERGERCGYSWMTPGKNSIISGNGIPKHQHNYALETLLSKRIIVCESPIQCDTLMLSMWLLDDMMLQKDKPIPSIAVSLLEGQ